MAYSSDVAFTPMVKAVQTRKVSRTAYAFQEKSGSWQTAISDDLKGFIQTRTTLFLGAASGDGQPYIQHRGGPPDFLRVLDPHAIGFVDFTGNRQYITIGNLVENPRVHLFLIDHAHRQRIKLWGTARVVDGDAELAAQLLPPANKVRAEQVILFSVTAWDANCPQHIPQKIGAAEVAHALAAKDREIAALQAEVARLMAGSA